MNILTVKPKFLLACHDSTRSNRCVEPMHFGCVELVEQHDSTRLTWRARLARHVERVERWHNEPSVTGVIIIISLLRYGHRGACICAFLRPWSSLSLVSSTGTSARPQTATACLTQSFSARYFFLQTGDLLQSYIACIFSASITVSARHSYRSTKSGSLHKKQAL